MLRAMATRLRRNSLVEPDAVPDDERLGWMLRGEGVEVVDWPFRGTLPNELYCEGTVGLRTGLTRPWRRWYMLHGLAHHLLHHGNQFYLWEHDRLTLARQECMADRLAGYVLLGSQVRQPHPEQSGITSCMLAEAAEVPVEMVERWWRLVAADLRLLALRHQPTGTD